MLEWPAEQPNPLAKVVWEYGTGSLQLCHGALRLVNFPTSCGGVHYADNLRLLCTGGSSPMTNTAYTIDVITGAITERSHMWFSRWNHGVSQYNGKFYMFGAQALSVHPRTTTLKRTVKYAEHENRSPLVHHLHSPKQDLPMRRRLH